MNSFCVVFVFLCVASNANPTISDKAFHIQVTEAQNDYRDGKIVGGQNADISEVPYQLSLEYQERHSCGASILSVKYALTAAHCVYRQSRSKFRLRSGSSFPERNGTTHPVENILIHEQYNPHTVDYDAAILKVIVPFVYSHTAQPVKIAIREPGVGEQATVSGWGTTQEGGSSSAPHLQSVQVPIFNRIICESRYQPYGGITDRMMCAGSPKHDSCQGDSGGPLVVAGEQVGIVSWGVGCGRAGFPGVYTNIADLEINGWIQFNAVLDKN